MQASGDKERGRQIRLSVHPESVFTEALPRFKEQMVAPPPSCSWWGWQCQAAPHSPRLAHFRGQPDGPSREIFFGMFLDSFWHILPQRETQNKTKNR